MSLIGLLVVGGYLRFYRIGQKGLWWDEVRTIEIAAAPGFHEELPLETLIDPAPSIRSRYHTTSFADFIASLKEIPHPPLFHSLMRIWFRLTGFSDNDAIYKIPPALFGTLAILLMFILGKWLHSSQLGLLAAAAFTLSPFQIYFSQELRSYTLLTLLILISYISFLLLLNPQRKWAFALLGLTYAVASYTHYFMFPVLLSQGLYLMTSPKARPYLRQWIKALCLAALLVALYLPRLLIVQHKVTQSVWVHEGPLFPQLLESLFSLPIKLGLGPEIGFLFYDLSRPQQLFWILAGVVCIVLWFYGLCRWLKADPARLDPCWLLASWAAVPVLFVLAIDLIRHSVVLSLSRYLSFVSPALFLLLAAGLLGLKRKLKWVLALGLSSVMLLVLVQYYQDPVKLQDWKGLSGLLQAQAGPRDLLVFNQVGRSTWLAPLNALCLTYYHGTEGHPIYLTGETLSRKTRELLQMRERFWLISQNRFFSDPGPPFQLISRTELEGIGPVALFEKKHDAIRGRNGDRER